MAEKQNIVMRGLTYFKESKEELKKIHTPSREETIRGTIGVLFMVFFFGLFLGLTDFFVGSFMKWLFT